MDSDSVLKALLSGRVALLVAPQSIRKLSWGVNGGDDAERTKMGEAMREKRRARRRAINVENGDGKEDRKRLGFVWLVIFLSPSLLGGMRFKHKRVGKCT